MERLEKLARPDEAATVVVPESVPPPGLAPMATVMLAEELVTVLPKASCTATWTAGEIATPAVLFDGCTLKASLEAAAGEMLNPLEVALVRPLEVAFKV